MAVYTGMRAALHPAAVDGTAQCRLAILFDAHADRLYRLARRLTTSREDARDLVQETFLRAAKSLQSVPSGRTTEEAWLVRVLVNIQRDTWRKELGEGAHDVNVDDALDAKRRVWRALALLPTRRRAILVMHELEGLSASEISGLLGITAVTVRWHVAVGRRSLKRLLKGDVNERRD
jgi:RNA polymerase sigma-70 factor (ECF subfamily)